MKKYTIIINNEMNNIHAVEHLAISDAMLIRCMSIGVDIRTERLMG